MRPAVTGLDHRRLGEDEALMLQPVHVFLDGVVAHTDGASDGAVARMALVGFSVLAVHQECENGISPESSPSRKAALGIGKKSPGLSRLFG